MTLLSWYSCACAPVGRFLSFIRFSHTVFALPFALGSMFVAAEGFPGWRIFGLILLCMILARTAAMTFNRVADWEIDKRNPRTEGRHRLLGRRAAIATCAASATLFIVTTVFCVDCTLKLYLFTALNNLLFHSRKKLIINQI